ncbi:MAG: rod shape-determining protein [Peptococcaceae bacterium]|nr:rod shape-determining protein [Peptococcaceae bacterium]
MEIPARWQPENTIFALDIGTRTVIGIVAGVEGDSLKILAQSMTEHQSRAVFDGQIHDIFKVAQAVKEVKSDLEEKMGFKLGKVAIAAAGRSLKTRFAHVEQEIGDDIEIDPVICRGLEMDAVKEAHRQLQEEGGDGQEEDQFFCVGYTVVNYYLNGYTMTSLTGHFGKRIGVDVLATFLPNSVVNSLYSVLGRVSLEPVSLTLEPIAAAGAIIPESYRLLNLALLDIGAGTSDIAITRDGSIVAYGMVPLAGDEITEAVAQGCLADFHTAEYIKREIVKGRDITFQDIMGIERTVSCGEILEMLDPVLESLAEKITGEILRLNGNKPPKSVFCVGGGGQLPAFTGKIAQKLGLPPERVGLRGRRFIPGLLADNDEISGPEGVTVVGIAKVALDSVGHNFITVNINGMDYKLFHSRELTVFDALGLIEYNLGDLVGKNGRDLRFVLNGERKVIYGGLCQPAEVFINGEPANLKSVLADGDQVTVRKAVRGEDARALAGDFIGENGGITLRIDGRLENVGPRCFVNGRPAAPDREIAEGDRVEIREVRTVLHLAEVMGIDLGSHEVFVNGKKAPGEKILTSGDSVEFVRAEAPGRPPGSRGADAGPGPGASIEVTVNGRKIVLADKPSYIFVDIFNHIDLDLVRTAQGGRIKLLLNGRNAGYTDPIGDGDVIEVGWD